MNNHDLTLGLCGGLSFALLVVLLAFFVTA